MFLICITWARAIGLSMTIKYLCDFQRRCLWTKFGVPIWMIADAFALCPLHILITWVIGPELDTYLFLGHAWTRAAMHSLVPKKCLKV
jgi:hypothetical protein